MKRFQFVISREKSSLKKPRSYSGDRGFLNFKPREKNTTMLCVFSVNVWFHGLRIWHSVTRRLHIRKLK